MSLHGMVRSRETGVAGGWIGLGCGDLQRVGGVGKPTVVAQRRVVESSDAHAPEALLPIVRWHL